CAGGWPWWKRFSPNPRHRTSARAGCERRFLEIEVGFKIMPRVNVSGDLLQGIKGISIRDSEGHEFRMDLTQTQPPDVPRDDAAGIKGAAGPGGVDKSAPTATAHFSSNDELHDPPVG
ncbi:unnamed protein product, partial [Urochloa humidicola]